MLGSPRRTVAEDDHVRTAPADDPDLPSAGWWWAVHCPGRGRCWLARCESLATPPMAGPRPPTAPRRSARSRSANLSWRGRPEESSAAARPVEGGRRRSCGCCRGGGSGAPLGGRGRHGAKGAVDEAVEGVQRCGNRRHVRARRRPLSGAASRGAPSPKHCQRPQAPLVVGEQQVVAPADGRGQRRPGGAARCPVGSDRMAKRSSSRRAMSAPGPAIGCAPRRSSIRQRQPVERPADLVHSHELLPRRGGGGSAAQGPRATNSRRRRRGRAAAARRRPRRRGRAAAGWSPTPRVDGAASSTSTNDPGDVVDDMLAVVHHHQRRRTPASRSTQSCGPARARAASSATTVGEVRRGVDGVQPHQPGAARV